MAENAVDTKHASLIDEPETDALPPVMSLADDDAVSPPPQAVPVPTEDVVACAKAKCATCFGKGKLVYHAPGETKARAKVCLCAIRQFVRIHRRELFIDKSGRFYYIPVPDDEKPEVVKQEEDSRASSSELSDYNRERIRGMFARIAAHEVELAELDERYARMSEPIDVELVAAKDERAGEAAKLQSIVDRHAQLVSEVEVSDRKIEDLAARLFDAKREKLSLEGKVAEALKEIAGAEDAALPGLRKQAGIEARLAGVARKRQKFRKPIEHRIASLRKRIAHLAAVNSIPDTVLAELAIPADDVPDVADEAADEIAAEAGAEAAAEAAAEADAEAGEITG
jgi:hypothetical protein